MTFDDSHFECLIKEREEIIVTIRLNNEKKRRKSKKKEKSFNELVLTLPKEELAEYLKGLGFTLGK